MTIPITYRCPLPLSCPDTITVKLYSLSPIPSVLRSSKGVSPSHSAKEQRTSPPPRQFTTQECSRQQCGTDVPQHAQPPINCPSKALVGNNSVTMQHAYQRCCCEHKLPRQNRMPWAHTFCCVHWPILPDKIFFNYVSHCVESGLSH